MDDSDDDVESGRKESWDVGIAGVEKSVDCMRSVDEL